MYRLVIILFLLVLLLVALATYRVQKYKQRNLVGKKGIIQHKLSDNQYLITVEEDGLFINCTATPEEIQDYSDDTVVIISSKIDQNYYFTVG